ncbi:MAG: DUF951 domain-containing protein [Eubacteriales bacterium]|nr:DUF951 domain-containing protein [Clostridiales bacterium]
MVVALAVGDTVQMRKKHPCGSELFTVLRVGSDVRIRCLGCQRDLTLERVKLEKAIRKVIPGGKGDV